MTWETIPSDERAKLRVEDSESIRFKCVCGCGKFAVIVEAGENRIDREALAKVKEQLEDSFNKAITDPSRNVRFGKIDIQPLPPEGIRYRSQWQLVCLNCKERHV